MSLFDTGVIPFINQHILEESEKVRDYGDYWSASSAGYCMRLNIMRRLKIPPVPEIEESKARTQRVFSVGHIFHEWIQRQTREAGISIAQEVELQDEDLLVRGHFDDLILVEMPSANIRPEVRSGADDGFTETKPQPNVINRLDNSRLILYDYKTVNSQSFKYKKDKMSHYHRMQLGTYMYMLRKANPKTDKWYMFNYDLKDLTEARILNISKDDLRLSEFQLIWDDKLEKDVVAYWTTLNKHWEARTWPKCTCADHEGGFMGKRSSKGKVYNDYFWEDEPCSGKWALKTKEEGLWEAQS